MVDFVLGCMEHGVSGLIEKSRDVGATWTCCGVSVWLWLFRPGAAVGWGSRKEMLVDRIGDPASIFHKLRRLLDSMPALFLPAGFDRAKHMSYMKIINPATDSVITRRGRRPDRPRRPDDGLLQGRSPRTTSGRSPSTAALADNTLTQIDLSSVSGPGTVFHRKREGRPGVGRAEPEIRQGFHVGVHIRLAGAPGQGRTPGMGSGRRRPSRRGFPTSFPRRSTATTGLPCRTASSRWNGSRPRRTCTWKSPSWRARPGPRRLRRGRRGRRPERADHAAGG